MLHRSLSSRSVLCRSLCRATTATCHSWRLSSTSEQQQPPPNPAAVLSKGFPSPLQRPPRIKKELPASTLKNDTDTNKKDEPRGSKLEPQKVGNSVEDNTEDQDMREFHESRLREVLDSFMVKEKEQATILSRLSTIDTATAAAAIETPIGVSKTAVAAEAEAANINSQLTAEEKWARSRALASTRLVITREVSDTGMEWIDVKAHPTAALDDYRNGIAAFLLDLGVHETIIESTMEAVLLPQTVITDDCVTLIVRCAVEGTTYEMDSIQELTNRLTVLFFAGKVVTVHRTHMPMFNTLRKHWKTHHQREATPAYMLNLLVKECSRTFHTALAGSIVLFDKYESMLFTPQRHRGNLAREIYHIKRRASVYSRILAQTSDSYHVAVDALKLSRFDAYAQDVEQDVAHARNLADELNDNAQAVLQLLFQLSSYQLNELMRVLTMFSALFIPLSFIASVYGMNFDNLPGIHSDNGHLMCMAFMVMVAGSLMGWFKVKGFW